MILLNTFEMNARPHPDPLPRGEGTAMDVFGEFQNCFCSRRPFGFGNHCSAPTGSPEQFVNRRMILPLPGGEGRGEGGRNHSFFSK